jgi:hypothetical protein
MLKMATRFLRRVVWIERPSHRVSSRQAFYCDDLGTRVEARLLGEAPDQLHTWDIKAVFAFDAEQRVLSYSISEC